MSRNHRIAAGLSALLFSCTFAGQTRAAESVPYVVKQGTAQIDFTDIDGRVARIPATKRAGYMNDPDRIETTLRSLLLIRQMAKEAEDLGLDKDPVVAAEIELARQEILAKRRIAKVVAEVQVPSMEALAKERYATSPAMFSTPETLVVRHLLILREKHGDEAAKALADKLRAEIDASPMLDFEAFAKKHSEEGKAAETGGLLKPITRGDTLADFETAAFALEKPGQYSPVVRTRYGYHIIQLVSRTPATRIPYEKVKDGIVRELESEYVARVRGDYLSRAQSLKLEADPDKVQSLRTRYLPEGEGTKAIGVRYNLREQIADEADKAAAAAAKAAKDAPAVPSDGAETPHADE